MTLNSTSYFFNYSKALCQKSLGGFMSFLMFYILFEVVVMDKIYLVIGKI